MNGSSVLGFLGQFFGCVIYKIIFVIVHFHSQNCLFIYISFYFSNQKYDYCLPADIADFYSYYSSASQSRRMWFEPTWFPGIVLALRFPGLPWILSSNIRIIFQISHSQLFSPFLLPCRVHYSQQSHNHKNNDTSGNKSEFCHCRVTKQDRA